MDRNLMWLAAVLLTAASLVGVSALAAGRSSAGRLDRSSAGWSQERARPRLLLFLALDLTALVAIVASQILPR